MFRQLFLEDKNHHSVGEVSQESHFKAFEEVSVAQLSRLPESGECPHLLSTSLVHGNGLEGVHGLGEEGCHASCSEAGRQMRVHILGLKVLGVGHQLLLEEVIEESLSHHRHKLCPSASP